MAIYFDYTVTVKDNESKLDKSIYLYQGNRNIDYYFTIKEAPFKYSKPEGENIIEKLTPSHAAVTLLRTSDGVEVGSGKAEVLKDKIKLTIDKEMIDEDIEVGKYTMVIDLLDDEKDSIATLPPIVDQFEIFPRVTSLSFDGSNIVNEAIVGQAVVTSPGEPLNVFDDQGNYIKTVWKTGNRIVAEKLNKIEDAIYQNTAQIQKNKEYANDNATGKYAKTTITSENIIGKGDDLYWVAEEIENPLSIMLDTFIALTINGTRYSKFIWSRSSSRYSDSLNYFSSDYVDTVEFPFNISIYADNPCVEIYDYNWDSLPEGSVTRIELIQYDYKNKVANTQIEDVGFGQITDLPNAITGMVNKSVSVPETFITNKLSFLNDFRYEDYVSNYNQTPYSDTGKNNTSVSSYLGDGFNVQNKSADGKLKGKGLKINFRQLNSKFATESAVLNFGYTKDLLVVMVRPDGTTKDIIINEYYTAEIIPNIQEGDYYFLFTKTSSWVNVFLRTITLYPMNSKQPIDVDRFVQYDNKRVYTPTEDYNPATKKYVDLQINTIEQDFSSQFKDKANKNEIGSPLTANTVAEMTDTSKVYVYTGSEEGYINGNWYSHNGTSWISGGVYNSQGIGNKSITPIKTSFLIEGENKLNIHDSSCRKGYYLNWDNTEQVKEGVSISHKIPVKNGDIICFSRCHLTSTNWGLLYDSEGNKLAGLNSIGEEHDENEDAYKYKKVTINNENASYIKINFLNNDLKVKPMLFFYETFPLEYIPYKFKIDSIIDLNLGQSVNYNILEGKTLLTFGDSVMYGAGGTVGAFAKMIADKNNMILINKAKSGYTICVNADYPSRGSILKEVETSISNNDSADYILIEGGFNDVFVKSKCPIGTISTDYITFDNTTFTGALESLFKQVLTKWYDKKILFILGHQLYRSLNDVTTPFDFWIKNQNMYWDRAIEVCKKWNIPFLDMRLSGFMPLTDKLLAKYFAESNQSTHPNDLGYKLIYVDKVESKMKSL